MEQEVAFLDLVQEHLIVGIQLLRRHRILIRPGRADKNRNGHQRCDGRSTTTREEEFLSVGHRLILPQYGQILSAIRGRNTSGWLSEESGPDISVANTCLRPHMTYSLSSRSFFMVWTLQPTPSKMSPGSTRIIGTVSLGTPSGA